MKKLLSLSLLAIILFCILSSSAFADAPSFSDTVEASLASFPIKLNGESFDNANAEYPFVVYKGITYMPLTWNNMHRLGVRASFFELGDNSPRSQVKYAVTVGNSVPDLSLVTEEATGKQNPEKLSALVYGDSVAVQSYFSNNDSEYPFLYINHIYYMPLTWSYVKDMLDWDYSFDAVSGMKINTASSVRPVLSEDSIKAALANAMGGSTYREHYIYGDNFYIAHDFSLSYLYVVDKNGKSTVLNLWEEPFASYKISKINGLLYLDTPLEAPSYEKGVLTFFGVCKNSDGVDVNVKLTIDMSVGEMLSCVPLENLNY